MLGANFSPEDNRKIPPLKYDYVYNLVKDFPYLRFTINGGIQTLTEVKGQLSKGNSIQDMEFVYMYVCMYVCTF